MQVYGAIIDSANACLFTWNSSFWMHALSLRQTAVKGERLVAEGIAQVAVLELLLEALRFTPHLPCAMVQ